MNNWIVFAICLVAVNIVFIDAALYYNMGTWGSQINFNNGILSAFQQNNVVLNQTLNRLNVLEFKNDALNQTTRSQFSAVYYNTFASWVYGKNALMQQKILDDVNIFNSAKMNFTCISDIYSVSATKDTFTFYFTTSKGIKSVTLSTIDKPSCGIDCSKLCESPVTSPTGSVGG